MKQACAIALIAAFISSNCAARGSSFATRPITERMVSSDGSPSPASERERPDPSRQDTASPEVWRRYAEKLPIGSTLKIQTNTGERLTALLLVVDDTGVTVKPKTRLPEPIRRVPFDRLEQLELEQGGANLAKAAVVGGAVGAGVFFGLMMLLFAGLD